MEKKLKFIVQDNTQGWQEDLPLRLMFQDEARFGLISESRRCWCPKPERPICKTMISQQYTYAYSAVSILEGNINSLVLPYVNTSCMQIFLNEVSSRYPNERILDHFMEYQTHYTTTIFSRTQPRGAYMGRSKRNILSQ